MISNVTSWSVFQNTVVTFTKLQFQNTIHKLTKEMCRLYYKYNCYYVTGFLVHASQLTLELLHNTCNMGNHGLTDISLLTLGHVTLGLWVGYIIKNTIMLFGRFM